MLNVLTIIVFSTEDLALGDSSGALIPVPEKTIWVLAPARGTSASVTGHVASSTASDLVGSTGSVPGSCLEGSCIHPTINCPR